MQFLKQLKNRRWRKTRSSGGTRTHDLPNIDWCDTNNATGEDVLPSTLLGTYVKVIVSCAWVWSHAVA